MLRLPGWLPQNAIFVNSAGGVMIFASVLFHRQDPRPSRSGPWVRGTWALVLLVCCSVQSVTAEVLHVAVASNFAGPMRELAKGFETQHGHHVNLSFGSSGKLFAQIEHGAPFDVFLSADQHKIDVLVEKGLAVPDSQFSYAIGTLVLWAPDQIQTANPLVMLKEGRFAHLAMANPLLAPYGQAAEEVLRRLGLLASTTQKQVLGDNINQAFQFVATGNAELGFVALSQVLALPAEQRGQYWRVPAELAPPILQDAALLQRSSKTAAATALLGYLAGAEGQAVIRRYGYDVVSATTPSD